jgi:hypothetical protein
MGKKQCNILLILLNGVIASMYQVLKDSSEEDVTLQGSNNSNQIVLRTRGHKKRAIWQGQRLKLEIAAILVKSLTTIGNHPLLGGLI